MDFVEGSGSLNFAGGLHPLLIPEVVENVFNFCSFKDLTSCRLVSKVWHDNSLKRWRSLAKVRLVREDCRRPMTRFMNFVKDEKRKPNSSKPYSGHFVIGMVRNLNPFLQEFRFQISALELKNITFKNTGEFRKVIFQSCPNMKELILLNPIRATSRRHPIAEPIEWIEPQFEVNLNLKRLTLPRSIRSFGITRIEILSHFPALEALIQKERSFQTETWAGSDDDLLFNVVEIIRNHDPRKLKLKSIEDLEIVQPESDSCLPISLFSLLANPPSSLQLEHLAVVLDGGVSSAQVDIGYTIMYRQCNTLRKLDLHRTPSEGYLNPKSILEVDADLHLDNLQELTLRSRVFSSLLFLTFMRNLKKLTTYGYDNDYLPCLSNIVKATGWKCSMMNHLVLDKCTELNLAFHLDKVDLEKILGIFPNLEKLTISLSNEKFAVVCKNWRKLVELNVYDSFLDDSGITGLDEEEIASANHKRSLVSHGEARERKPNISWLPHLRRVSISNWQQFQITRSLGHASATFGFQQVPHLEYLHITNYNVEEDVKEALCASATSCVFTSVHREKETWLEGLRKSLFVENC